MNPDQTAPNEQSDLGYIVCRLPKNIRRREEKTKMS